MVPFRSAVSFFLLLVLSLSAAQGQTATAPSSGDGTSGDPYQVATLDNLYWITQNNTQWN